MRIIMMGTGPFGAPAFRHLCKMRHDVVALVTSPLRVRKGRKPPLPEVREIAAENDIEIFDPESINTPEAVEQLKRYDADLIFVCDYGQILKPPTIGSARLGGLNLHGSLLPKYRGAAPVNWAVYNGEATSGITVIQIVPQVDAGPCIAAAETPIGPEETAPELEARLAEMGVLLVCQAIDMVEADKIEPITQDNSLASKAPRLKKSDGEVDWSKSAEQIRNQIRAFVPWPKSFTFWHRDGGKPVRLILGPVDVVDVDVPWGAQPGTLLEVSVSGRRLVVITGNGALAPRSVQPAGKKMLAVDEFLRGYHLKPGDRLGPE